MPSTLATYAAPIGNLKSPAPWRLTTKRGFFFLTIFIVLILSGWPLGNLLRLGLRSIDLSLFDAGVLKVVINTLILGVFATLFSLILGTTFGFLLERTNVLGKKNIKSFLLYPYIIPSIIMAIGWMILANPGVGLIKPLLPWINIYSMPGIVLVETLSWYTFVMLNVMNVLSEMDGSLEESARMCGASPSRIFFTVTLPLLKPALIGSAILVFLCSVSSFAVPAILGGPGKIYVLTTKIYQWIKIGTPGSVLEAMMLSIPIVIMAFVLGYAAEKWLTRRSFATLTGKHNRKLEINLRQWRWPVSLLFFFFGLIFIAMPLATILVTSLMKSYGDWNLSFGNYVWLLWREDTQAAILNSLGLAVVGAVIIAVLSFFIAYYRQKTHYRMRNLLVTLASLPYAAPGTILAMAILFTFSGASAYFLLLFAYVAKYLNYGIRVLSPAVSNIDKSLEESSLMCGASWLKTITTVWLPVLKGTFATTIFLLIAPLFSECTMSLMLSGPEAPTVGIRLFHLQEYESPPLASVLAVVILVLVAGLNLIAKKLSRGKLGV